MEELTQVRAMEFIKKLRKALAIEPSIPNIGMTPQEININISPQSRAALIRHASRLSRILDAPKTPELEGEIKMRQGSLMMAGFNAPKKKSAAIEIIKQLGDK